jgi:elongation factor Ts
MAAISATQVKELREKTGAGMMDCKAALQETGGDAEAAVDWLRKKGLAAAAKKAGRQTSEGLIGVKTEGRRAAMIELNSETDFVARNDEFQKLVRSITELAPAAGGDLEALLDATVPETGRTVRDEVTRNIAVIGENLTLRRTAAVEVDRGAVGSYVHAALAPGLGKIGVLVGLRSTGDPAALAELGRQLAMHVAAAAPLAVSTGGLDADTLRRERAIYADQARGTGKPEAIIEKIVDGRMRKYYEDVVLLEQAFVVNTDLRVKEAVALTAKEIGAPIEVTEFVRFQLGEGMPTAEPA